jgi:hypothetical protein
MSEKSQEGQEKWIEIARVGRFRDSAGAWHDFTFDRLRKIAAKYDPSRRDAPLVLGHPTVDGPAHGWIKRLAVSGDKLFAQPAYVTAALKEAVDNGLYRHVSMSLYDDDGLRHVGILGATPPAIDGLAPLSFSGDAAATFDFDNGEKENQMTIEELTQKVADLTAQLAAAAQEKEAALKEAAGLKEELAKLKGEGEQAAAEFAAYRQKQEAASLSSRLDALVMSGRLAPAEKPGALKTAQTLYLAGQSGVKLNFSSAAGEDKEDALETYLKGLEARQPLAIFSDFGAMEDDGRVAYDKAAKPRKPLSAGL